MCLPVQGGFGFVEELAIERKFLEKATGRLEPFSNDLGPPRPLR